MRRFRHFFTAVFIAATLLSALHEIIHDHHQKDSHVEESCPLYLLAQTPVVLQDTLVLPFISFIFIPFLFPKITKIATAPILSKSRSPPSL